MLIIRAPAEFEPINGLRCAKPPLSEPPLTRANNWSTRRIWRRAAISRFRQKASQKASKRRAVGTTSPGALSFAKGKSPAGENFFGGPEVFSNRKIAISARFSPSRVIYLIYFRSIFCSIFVLSCCCSVLLTKSIPKGVISVAPLEVL